MTLYKVIFVDFFLFCLYNKYKVKEYKISNNTGEYMAYNHELVQIPKESVHRSKGYIYLITERKYSPERKGNIYKKKLIGKAVDDQTMLPNDRYFQYFGEPEEQLSEPNVDRSDALKIGNISMLRSLMDSTGLLKKLDLVFGQDRAALLADLASYICTSGSSAMQHFPVWAYEHPLLSGLLCSDSTISRFMNQNVSNDDINAFFKEWNRDRDQQETLYINGDATNMNTDCRGVELAEMGYAKEDKTKPQINIALAATHDGNMPLFYDLYAGSYNDVSEIHYMIRMADEFGYRNLGFILDRGYFSQENLNDLANRGYQLVIMLKSNNLCVQEIIESFGEQLKSKWNQYIPEHSVYGMTVQAPLFKTGNKNYSVHLYYSDEKAKKEREGLVTFLKKYEQELNQAIDEKNLNLEAARKYLKYFDLDIDENGIVTGYRENQANIAHAYGQCGFFSIAATEDLSAEEAIDIYRERDTIEKLFSSMKTGMDCRRFRVHSDESLTTKVFIVFLATILRSQVHRILKTVRENDRKHFTVPAAVHELEKVIALLQQDGSYTLTRKLTSLQKRILKGFGVTEKTLMKLCKEL